MTPVAVPIINIELLSSENLLKLHRTELSLVKSNTALKSIGRKSLHSLSAPVQPGDNSALMDPPYACACIFDETLKSSRIHDLSGQFFHLSAARQRERDTQTLLNYGHCESISEFIELSPAPSRKSERDSFSAVSKFFIAFSAAASVAELAF